jgi:hypothetical protein
LGCHHAVLGFLTLRERLRFTSVAGSSIDVSPRWKHRCPACKKTVFWEIIYCKDCIKEVPRRGHFRLGFNQRWLKYSHLRGVPENRRHLFAVIKNSGNDPICVECGAQRIHSSLKHRCYSKPVRMIQKRTIICKICSERKMRVMFPLLQNKKLVLRSCVCSECLIGAKVVFASKRKYKKRRKKNAAVRTVHQRSAHPTPS